MDVVDGRLEAADALCARAGARLTTLRRDVLALVLQADAPPTAYQLLDRLRAQRGHATPPTVYRALDFLLEQGLVHRVERLNAFIGCVGGDAHQHHHQAQFLICTLCGRVLELDDAPVADALARAAKARGFLARRRTIEVEGVCKDCQKGQGSALDPLGAGAPRPA